MLSPNFSRNVFQPSSRVNSNFAGRGIYMPQSIKRDSGHKHHRNSRAVTLALQGRYVQTISCQSVVNFDSHEPQKIHPES